MAKAAVDHDAVIQLAAYWIERLNLDDVDVVEGVPELTLGTAAQRILGKRDVDDIAPYGALECGIVIGAGIALAVLNDPLGDPRKQLTTAMSSVKPRFERFAQSARDDLALEARRDALIEAKRLEAEHAEADAALAATDDREDSAATDGSAAQDGEPPAE